MNTKFAFSERSTTDEVLEGIDLGGKLALVTGGGGGIGRETARALASAGADVIVGGRSLPALAETAAAITQSWPGRVVHAFPLDLSSLESVDRFADAVLARERPVDMFVANAGIMAVPHARTADGIESQLATNFVGHAVLLSRLSSAVRAASGRIVSLSSSAHHFADVDFTDLNWLRRPYDAWDAYGQSKTACSLLARHAAARMKEAGVTALAVHPGVISTGLMGHLTEADYRAVANRPEMRGAGERFRKSVEQGAATSVLAASSPGLAGPWAYLEDCQIAEPAVPSKPLVGVKPYAGDPARAERLWAATEQLIGRHLPL